MCYWAAISWRDWTPHVLDYGVFDTHRDSFGSVEIAVFAALRSFRDSVVREGWLREEGGAIPAAQVWIDSGDPTTKDIVYSFCQESGTTIWKPAKGWGSSVPKNPHPTRGEVLYEGDGYQLRRTQNKQVLLAYIHADRWKGWLHSRIRGEGGISLFQADPKEHQSFCKHLVSEREIEVHKPGYPPTIRWEPMGRRPNHWLDAMYMACAAGDYIRVQTPTPAKKRKPQERDLRREPDPKQPWIRRDLVKVRRQKLKRGNRG